MGNYKEQHGNTRFGTFIKKASEIAPELIDAGIKLASGNVTGAMSEVVDILKSKSDSDNKSKELLKEFENNKSEFALEAYELESKDRDGARGLYKSDSLMQKIFGIIFMLGYIALSWYLLDKLMDNIKMSREATILITSIWTGTSMKLATIIDFFFGGSVKKE